MDKYYIYAYTHPDHGYVYIGKTISLENRIYSHDNSIGDNISREHRYLLGKCAVFYFELKSSLQMDYVEKYLIDFYNPLLNVQFKNDSECKLEMSLPKWKRYVRDYESTVDDYVYNPNNNTIHYSELLENKVKELIQVQKEITKVEEELKHQKEDIEHQMDLIGILKRRIKSCT